MAGNDDKTVQATILAGPGMIRQPAVIADGLDVKLQEIVARLEEVADCPTPTFDLPQGLSPAGRMLRFCEALAEMGEPALADLASAYQSLVKAQRFSPVEHSALFNQRAEALVEYFCQLALVHGVAFATEGQPPEQDAVDRALTYLRSRLQTAFEKLRADMR